MPDELDRRRLHRRIIEMAAVVRAVAVLVVVGPGLGSLSRQLAPVSPWWLAAALALKAQRRVAISVPACAPPIACRHRTNAGSDRTTLSYRLSCSERSVS
jgi:hypothetical protein